jgi:thiol:disulfide interchange protein DsbG
MTRTFRLPALAVASLFLLAFSWTALAAETPAPGTASLSPHQKIAETMLAGIHQATWITEGKGPHVIYIFFDPNCPACNQLYHSFRPLVEQGIIELHWIPVGILMTTSPGKAAALLEAKDRLAALAENEAKFSRENGFGGIAEEPLPTDATLKQLEANVRLLKHTVNMAVPTLLFRNKQNNATFIQAAPPPGPLSQIVREVK